jgi:hypothetical protein
MDKQQAICIIEETFKHSFDKSRFTNFIRNLLNHIDESKATAWSNQRIKDAFKEHVQHYERLGTYETPDKEKIDILIVHLTKESKLERARTAIRNFVADHLKTRNEKDAALVAFVSPTEQQWRFSYVKMEYAAIEKESGKYGVEARLTPARRFSYLVGEGESCHTAQTRFIGLLQDTETDPKLSDIEEAFSVEAVTKEFFTQYVKLFEGINKALEKLIARDKILREEFKEKNVTTVDFAKKLMGQIVFLYFIQKKGWLGVAKGKDWGTGPHDFLRRFANGEYGKYNNFFNDILEPLFYDTLATDRGHEAWCNRFKCRIPFLNGGLFEPLCDYDWRKTDIVLSNKLFLNSEYVEEGITGTGVLDVFDRYNFTVNEAEPLEKEVAIDPEMLGKVFENLIEENRRKSLGAHYTPREIVHYMCQESLINYLDMSLNKDTILVPREDIETFIHHGEQYSFYEAAKQSGTIGKDYPKPPKSIEKHARLIDEKLKEITVCDPAVGSGAFPVGMMMEIVRARLALTPYFNDVHERTAYHFKRHAIQNCLYGVDIDPSAVEIAKLRLWLSLVVDEEETNQIKPLPNLDYKIMQGNSLIEEYEGIKLFDEGLIKAAPIEMIEQIKHTRNKINSLQKLYIELHSAGKLTKVKKAEINEQMKQQQSILKQLQKGKDSDSVDADLFDALSAAKKNWEELKKKHQEFFSSSDKSQKDELRKRIANLELELIKATLEEQGKKSSIAKIEEHIRANTRPFFLWKLNFGEIFLSDANQDSGFDIVIANPPYIQMQKDSGLLADQLKNNGYETYERTGDVYSIFYELGYHLLKLNGIHTFITSSQWLRANYGRSLRKYFLKKDICKLIELGPDVFESAIVDTNILVGINAENKKRLKGCVIKKLNEIESLSDTRMLPMAYVSEDAWAILSPARQAINRKLQDKGKALRNWNIKINFGIKTGYNEAFIIDEEKKKELIKADKRSVEIIRPVLRGREIEKYLSIWEDEYIVFIPWHFPLQDDDSIKGASRKAEKHFKNNYPAVYEYLRGHKTDLEKRNKDETGIRYEWYALQRCAATYKEEFSKEKVIWKRIGSLLRFSYSDEKIFCLDSTCIATGEKIKYLTALLNSKLCHYQLFESSPKTGMGDLIISVQALEPILVHYPNEKEEKSIVALFNRIIEAKKRNPEADTTALECEIDNLVYELYGLTEEEIAIVEGKN